MFHILTINPGSTSTKIGVFKDEQLIYECNIHHSSSELEKYKSIDEQTAFRSKVIEQALIDANIPLTQINAISCRGGIIKRIASGTYLINEQILYDSSHSTYDHPSNLAALIGYDLGSRFNIPSFVTDPPSTYEAAPIAAISGSPFMERPMTFHALNHKAIAKRHCRVQNIDYQNTTLIVAHLGGGISIGIHHNGRVIDVTDALSEGPFSPERSGALPNKPLIELLISKPFSQQEAMKLIRGNAGFQAYLQTNNMKEILAKVAQKDAKATLYFDAFIYQIAKEIGAMATTVNGKVTAIILTGGIAHSELVVAKIKECTQWIAPVFAYPGEEELRALNEGVLSVLQGKEKVKQYL